MTGMRVCSRTASIWTAAPVENCRQNVSLFSQTFTFTPYFTAIVLLLVMQQCVSFTVGVSMPQLTLVNFTFYAVSMTTYYYVNIIGFSLYIEHFTIYLTGTLFASPSRVILYGLWIALTTRICRAAAKDQHLNELCTL
jgi:hypothetical protein